LTPLTVRVNEPVPTTVDEGDKLRIAGAVAAGATEAERRRRQRERRRRIRTVI
jgi:hypothetical protein